MPTLNLAAGKKVRADAINVDVMNYPGIDQIVDLSVFPWPWESNSVSGIYASHIMEHFLDQEAFILECYRILKVGGFLRIAGPHSSCISSTGCLGHYRTYSYDTFRQYLSEPWYMFKTKKFHTTYQRLNWWYEETSAEGNLSNWLVFLIRVINPIINMFINLSPRIYENVFAGVFQCREVIWIGEKL